MKKTIEQKTVNRISTTSIVVNILLFAFKLIAGIFGHSKALISDAVHSLSDVFSTIVVLVGIKISSKAPDSHHQYGHERFESVTAIILAAILAVTGVTIGLNGFNKIVSKSYLNATLPTNLALIAAIVSILVKEIMYWYTRYGAKKINSGALMADAWHHRSDSLSSLGALFGIIGSKNGFTILDPIATLVICFLILKVAFDIFKDGINKMVDASINKEDIALIKNEIMKVDGVMKIDLFKSRQFGNKSYIDVEISVDGNLLLTQAHEIAATVHENIENKFTNVKHCMVHVNPYKTN